MGCLHSKDDTIHNTKDVPQESRTTRIKRFHRTETSEGISVAAVSLHTGDFPPRENDDDDEVVPMMIESSKKPILVHKVSAISDVTVEDRQDISSPSTGTREEDIAVETLMNSIRQRWRNDPASSIGNNDKQQFQQVLKTLLADKEQLERILIARKYKLDPSTDLFFEQVRFRARLKPQSIRPRDIPNALPSGAWRLCGYSREGCVLSNYKLRHWNPNAYGVHSNSSANNKADLDQAVREYTNYVVYMMELQISQMRPLKQQFIVLFDLKGFKPSLVFRRNVRLMIGTLVYVAQAQYPERLYKTLLVNAPFGFEAAWKLIQPLLDEKTASKIHFCKLADLVHDIDPAVLSQEYGGNHAEYPISGVACAS